MTNIANYNIIIYAQIILSKSYISYNIYETVDNANSLIDLKCGELLSQIFHIPTYSSSATVVQLNFIEQKHVPLYYELY